jgi:hypothetical protein
MQRPVGVTQEISQGGGLHIELFSIINNQHLNLNI